MAGEIRLLRANEESRLAATLAADSAESGIAPHQLPILLMSDIPVSAPIFREALETFHGYQTAQRYHRVEEVERPLREFVGPRVLQFQVGTFDVLYLGLDGDSFSRFIVKHELPASSV